MLKRFAMTGALAALCAGVAVQAQTQTPSPAQPGQTPTTTQRESATEQEQGTTTLTGCVYREQDVPGRTPNVAEQAGVLEDYILADVKPSGSGAPAVTARMFKLEKISDDRLRAFVGKRVEVTGTIDAEAGDQRAGQATQQDQSAGPDEIELPEFEVTSIRAASGGEECPSTPSGR